MSQREKKLDEREVVKQEIYKIYEALVHSPALVM